MKTLRRYERALMWTVVALAALHLAVAGWMAAVPLGKAPGGDKTLLWWSGPPKGWPECRHGGVNGRCGETTKRTNN